MSTNLTWKAVLAIVRGVGEEGISTQDVAAKFGHHRRKDVTDLTRIMAAAGALERVQRRTNVPQPHVYRVQNARRAQRVLDASIAYELLVGVARKQIAKFWEMTEYEVMSRTMAALRRANRSALEQIAAEAGEQQIGCLPVPLLRKRKRLFLKALEVQA